MIQPTFLVFDTELGGTTAESSLLTAYFAVCDQKWNILNELDLKLKPNNGEYVLQPRSMEVNNIDISEHDKEAISYEEAGRILRDFLLASTITRSVRLIPVGKGIKGDVDRITSCLLRSDIFHEFVSHRTYDIGSLIIFLKRSGKIDTCIQESLAALGEYFDIEAKWHTAKGDTLACIEIIKMLESF